MAEAKGFAHDVCQLMARDTPRPPSYQDDQKPSERQNFFLDYLRNDRMATAVARLCRRGRDQAVPSLCR
ncbi:hypothetical protein [Rhizobium sp. RHZ02]|uniref:non-homologous end-joining DNA ligase LigD n=2 Tax=Rhizobium TaxID=379 RepID=UPI00391B9B7C